MKQAVADVTPASAGARHRTGRWFFVAMSAVMLALVVTGFARTFFLRAYFGTAHLPPGLQTLPLHLVVHAIVLTSWFLLFFVQTVLVASHRTGLHRRLGVAGAVLAAILVAVALIVTIRSVPRSPLNGTPLAEMPVVFGSSIGFLVAFSVLVTCGIYLRRRSETHKRLMFLASYSILGPAVGRIPQVFPGMSLAVWLSPWIALILYDVVCNRRVHRATIWGGILAILAPILGAILAVSPPGQAFLHTLG